MQREQGARLFVYGRGLESEGGQMGGLRCRVMFAVGGERSHLPG